LLKFLVETRLQSKSFYPLIGFLGFLVKNVIEITNFSVKLPMFGINFQFYGFVGHYFWTRNLSQSKV